MLNSNHSLGTAWGTCPAHHQNKTTWKNFLNWMWISVGRGKLWIQFKRLDTRMLLQKNINKINHARWTHFDLVEAWTASWETSHGFAFYVLLARLVSTWTSPGSPVQVSCERNRSNHNTTHALETFSDFVSMMNQKRTSTHKISVAQFYNISSHACIYIWYELRQLRVQSIVPNS